MEKWMRIEEIFDLKEWEKLQDVIATESKMAITIVNAKGEPVTKHSQCHNFCRAAREDKQLNKYCQRCDARAGFEAMQNQEVFIYQCYFSVVDIAIPIVVKNRYIGAIMAGQVRLRPEDEAPLETILYPSEQEYVRDKRKEWDEMYEQLPYLSYGRIKIIAKMLYHLCNYMCTESSNKLQAIEMYEAVFENQRNMEEAENASGMGQGQKKKTSSDNIISSEQCKHDKLLEEMNSYLGTDYKYYHKVIKDIFEYIFEHKEEKPSLKEMADYCNVSSGYLSHLFTKETGESYSAFLTRMKMEWAKGMLETTDATITEISEKLGFLDTAYFIKVFKKQVGVTPFVYKKYCKMH